MLNQLTIAPLSFSLVMLAAMFASIFCSARILASHIPQLIDDAQGKAKWLCGLRGCAAAIVALNHAPMVMTNLQLTPQNFYFPQSQHALFNFFGSLGVQIFFCITGALFTNKIWLAHEIDWASFFKKRLFRLVPAYVAAATLALVAAVPRMQFYAMNMSESLNDLPRIFAFGLMPLPTIGYFDFNRLLGINWSLAYEWRYYVILPFVFLAIKKFQFLPSLLVITAFAAGDVILTGSSVWVYFVSGAICAPFLHKKFSRKTELFGTATIVAVLVVYIFCWDKFHNFGLQRWVLMTAFFMAIAIAPPRALTLRPFVAMGSMSYSFYLFHAMIILFVFKAFHKLEMDVTLLSLWSFTALACLALTAASTLSALSYLKIERPFMRLPDTTKISVRSPQDYASSAEASVS